MQARVALPTIQIQHCTAFLGPTKEMGTKAKKMLYCQWRVCSVSLPAKYSGDPTVPSPTFTLPAPAHYQKEKKREDKAKLGTQT